MTRFPDLIEPCNLPKHVNAGIKLKKGGMSYQFLKERAENRRQENSILRSGSPVVESPSS
jgi:hypothetical protein